MAKGISGQTIAILALVAVGGLALYKFVLLPTAEETGFTDLNYTLR